MSTHVTGEPAAFPDLLDRFRSSSLFRKVEDAFTGGRRGPRRLQLLGARTGLKTMIASALPARRVIWVVDGLEEAYRVRTDLAGRVPADRLEIAPGPDSVEGHVLPLSWQEILHRLKALMTLSRPEGGVVVAPFAGAVTMTLAPGRFREAILTLETGATCPLEAAVERLDLLGYHRVSNTQTRGEFSLRGGILDVFPPQAGQPLRLEFFGDDIEEIREFNPVTQRSTAARSRVEIPPAREILLADREIETIDANMLSDEMAALLQRTGREGSPKGAELLLARLPAQRGHLLDYLDEDDLLIWDVSPRACSKARATLDPAYPEGTLDRALRALEDRDLLAFWPPPGELCPLPVLESGTALPVNLEGDLDRMIGYIRETLDHGRYVIFVVGTRVRIQRAQELFAERDVPHAVGVLDEVLSRGPSGFTRGMVFLVQGDLDSGFVLEEDGLVVLSEHDVWGGRVVREEERDAPPRAPSAAFTDFTDLEEGTLVVHIDHGIGKFHRLTHLIIDGIKQEYLEIGYARGDKLFVPISQLDRVQRFIGVEEGRAPSLSKLGTARWSKTKSRVRENVAGMARQLVAIYARREVARARACGPDTVWQRELEESFPFEETRDQRQTWKQVRTDLEEAKPADRLVCGDVGFGKTEIAIRAAFKMVQEGRQVAVLVPTTILAQQHVLTFSERLSGYPVSIHVLSRLRSKPEQDETLRLLAQGKADIVIGTHRLLSKDVRFRDLGLLVVDEEQRFGVKHKERLKELAAGIHIVSLSATPIPRTLNLTLGGLRDISVINTPPRGRIPIKTFVTEFQDTVVRGAIKRELERAGQVYYVYNRIESMAGVEAWLRRLVPEARIRCGHGRLSADRLEQLMEEFYQGRFDVLVSTTIIESGLDIPNVNTLLVHDASTMGLSQLYQLRGRVGRSRRQAFAYFLFPGRTLLSDLAYERLKALEENTELGAGFKIAMRDLELRGAGNLLGEEQHGFIHSIGFEMYTRLLREAVAEIQGRDDLRPVDACKVDLRVDSYIPEEYIADPDTRVMLYRRLAAIESEEGLEEARAEIQDRFGPPPEKLQGLYEIIGLKTLASRLGVRELKQEGQQVRFSFSADRPPPSPWIDGLLDSPFHRVTFEPGNPPVIRLDLGLRRNFAIVAFLRKVLGRPTPPIGAPAPSDMDPDDRTKPARPEKS